MSDVPDLPNADDQLDEMLTFGDPATRRIFLKQVAGTGAALALGPHFIGRQSSQAAEPDAASAEAVDVRLVINGREAKLRLDPRVTLLDALRERLTLTGTKKGCDHGQCGACTVLVNGRRINSCLSLAVMHEGDEITTIEGLGTPAKLHPMQAAFIKHDGFQCGYCTPGQICSAIGMLDEIKRGVPSAVTADLKGGASVSAEEIRERMSGNICRCSAYPNIVAAIEAAATANGASPA